MININIGKVLILPEYKVRKFNIRYFQELINIQRIKDSYQELKDCEVYEALAKNKKFN